MHGVIGVVTGDVTGDVTETDPRVRPPLVMRSEAATVHNS